MCLYRLGLSLAIEHIYPWNAKGALALSFSTRWSNDKERRKVGVCVVIEKAMVLLSLVPVKIMEYETPEGPLCLYSSAFCENDGISQIFEMEMKQILMDSVLCLAKENTTYGLQKIPCAYGV